jgi:hypothetical protein
MSGPKIRVSANHMIHERDFHHGSFMASNGKAERPAAAGW